MHAKKAHVCRVAARPLAGQPLERHRATNSLYFQECNSGAHAVRTGSRAGCGETSRGRAFPWIESAPVPCSIAYHFQPKRNSGRKSSPVWISHNMFLRPGGPAHHRTHLMCLVVEDYDVSHNAFYSIIFLLFYLRGEFGYRTFHDAWACSSHCPISSTIGRQLSISAWFYLSPVPPQCGTQISLRTYSDLLDAHVRESSQAADWATIVQFC